MTDTLTPPPTPTTTPSPAPSGAAGVPGAGADLARIALHQARAAAKARGQATRAPQRRPRPNAALPDRRDPAGFATVLQHLMAERAWDMPAAGGTVLAQWPGIAAAVSPTLSAHVQATGYDPDTGRLDLRPDSPAYATQLRLLTARIIATANEHTGASAVRALRVLPPGAVDATPAVDRPAPGAAAAPAGPVKTRETASAGYRLALDAHRAAVDPAHQRPAAPDDGESRPTVRRTRRIRRRWRCRGCACPPPWRATGRASRSQGPCVWPRATACGEWSPTRTPSQNCGPCRTGVWLARREGTSG
ncbi:DciA family protein [Streptomyces sp. C10-9-1]|uniref:DciA family protein n=1 Tax=Streptomyces sp. C10-9-1 TaxID=1859285 RepID=UPI003D7168B9